MEIYNKFAQVYDKMGHDAFSIDMVSYTEKLLRRFRFIPGEGLELCCGTGTALRLFAEAGMKMTGLDQSAVMVRRARTKTKGLNVRIVRQSLPRFFIPDSRNRRRPAQFDLVTCYYDSLNYMKSERELGDTFKSVARHMRPGGHFIFDMNTPRALNLLWDSEVWGDARDDLAWVWRSHYDRNTASSTLMATFFSKQGKLWKRYDEKHVEYGYSNTAIKRLLREAGFTVRGYFKCLTFEPVDKKTYRICAVARKRT